MPGRGRGIGRWRWITAPFEPGKRWLAGFALWGFFIMSVLATGLGFADLRIANTGAQHLSPVELALTIATTLFVVSAMVVALHKVVAAGEAWWVRPIAFVFYLFFAVWSVGFGYGFFWKELAGQEFTERQFQRAISGLSASMDRAGQALDAAGLAVTGASALAAERAGVEAREGRTCANQPYSVPGDGPLTRSRFAFADRAGALGAEVRGNWIALLAARGEVLQRRAGALASHRAPAVLDTAERDMLERLAAAASLPAAERRALFLSVHDDAIAFAAMANNLRGLHAAAIAGRLEALAAEVGADPSRPGSADPARASDPGYCWDVVLHGQLIAAAAQVRSLEDVAAPHFEFIEGPAATRAAVFSLASWAGAALGFKAGDAPQIAFGEREFLALFASIAVDLGIVFLTIVREAPPREPPPVRAAGGAPSPPRLRRIIGS